MLQNRYFCSISRPQPRFIKAIVCEREDSDVGSYYDSSYQPREFTPPTRQRVVGQPSPMHTRGNEGTFGNRIWEKGCGNSHRSDTKESTGIAHHRRRHVLPWEDPNFDHQGRWWRKGLPLSHGQVGKISLTEARTPFCRTLENPGDALIWGVVVGGIFGGMVGGILGLAWRCQVGVDRCTRPGQSRPEDLQRPRESSPLQTLTLRAGLAQAL